MVRKSKFLTFILSWIPGLGHLYLGFNVRGGAFFFAEMAVMFLAVVFGAGFGMNRAPILMFLISVIWLGAIVDSMVLVDKYNWLVQTGKNHNEIFESMEMEKQNKKIIAMCLSIIPGAGHMYLGLQRQGVQLMTMFFLGIFLTDWLRVSLFMFAIPVIWFYSLFDVMYKASGINIKEDNDILLVSWLNGQTPLIKNTSKFMAYVFIGIGAFLLFDRIAMPQIAKLVQWNIKEYIQTIIIALLFIAGGIKLLMGSKKNPAAFKEDELL